MVRLRSGNDFQTLEMVMNVSGMPIRGEKGGALLLTMKVSDIHDRQGLLFLLVLLEKL